MWQLTVHCHLSTLVQLPVTYFQFCINLLFETEGKRAQDSQWLTLLGWLEH